MLANSFLAVVAWLMCWDVIHNSRPTFPRASRQRARTETFADSGHCKSKTSFHRGRHGERWPRPRSFRRLGLWSRTLIHSLFSLSRLRSLHFGSCGCVSFPVINHGRFTGNESRMKCFRAFQRREANGSVESAAHACARGIQLSREREERGCGVPVQHTPQA